MILYSRFRNENFSSGECRACRWVRGDGGNVREDLRCAVGVGGDLLEGQSTRQLVKGVQLIIWSTVNKRHRRDGVRGWRTPDTDMARSAADGLLDLAMDNIIAGVAINLAESPDLVVSLYVVEIPNQYTWARKLADLIGNEDFITILVNHVRSRDTQGTGGRDGERPDVRVVGKMQVVTLSGDDTC